MRATQDFVTDRTGNLELKDFVVTPGNALNEWKLSLRCASERLYRKLHVGWVIQSDTSSVEISGSIKTLHQGQVISTLLEWNAFGLGVGSILANAGVSKQTGALPPHRGRRINTSWNQGTAPAGGYSDPGWRAFSSEDVGPNGLVWHCPMMVGGTSSQCAYILTTYPLDVVADCDEIQVYMRIYCATNQGTTAITPQGEMVAAVISRNTQ